MAQFVDNQNRKWVIELTIGAVKRVRKNLNIDLIDIQDGKIFKTLAEDPVILAEVLASVLQPAIQKAQITEEEFGESLRGDSLANALEALYNEIVEFFPDPKRRLLRMALDQAEKQTAKIVQQTMDEMQSGKLSTNLQVSQE